MLTGLDALVERAEDEEQMLRNYLLALSDRLQSACSRADIYCASDNLQLEPCGDDEAVFGYIYCNDKGLMIASAFSGDRVAYAPGEEILYSVTTVKECPLTWLRAICRREVIEAFLTQVQEQVLQRTDELRTRVVELATLAVPADRAAAAAALRRLPALRATGPVAVEIAPGELLDKITILEIKARRLTDPRKLAQVNRELAVLQQARDRVVPASDELARLESDLGIVNRELWEVEDSLRACERDRDFGPRFVELARSVYRQNDRRATLKRQINDLLGASFGEQKEYPEYA
jgi:hypothetical protein